MSARGLIDFDPTVPDAVEFCGYIYRRHAGGGDTSWKFVRSRDEVPEGAIVRCEPVFCASSDGSSSP